MYKAIFGTGLCLFSCSVNSAIVYGSFSGHVTGVADNANHLSGVIAPSDALTGTFVYATDVPNASTNPDAFQGHYTDPAYSIIIHINGHQFTTAYVMPDGWVGDTLAVGLSNSATDIFGIQSFGVNDDLDNPPPNDSFLPLVIEATFEDTTGTVFSDANSLPTSLNLADFDVSAGTIWSALSPYALNYQIDYEITSLVVKVVPVPQALWLFGSGFVVLYGVVKRKRR